MTKLLFTTKSGLSAMFALWLVAGSTASSAEEARQIRLGDFPNITHAQAIYGRSGNLFERRTGASIRWNSFNAGPAAMEAMFADAIDATFIGPGPAVNGFIKSGGEKFAIIAGAASGGAGLVVRKDSGIKSEKDFGDKIIATPQLANTQDIAARVWFGERGYKFKEKGGSLTLLALSNPDQLTLFRKKQIDGAWTVEPWLSRLESEGEGELFLDEKTLWPDGRYATTVLIMNREFLLRNPALTKKLLAALVDVTGRINADKKAAAAILNAELKSETGKALPDWVISRALDRVEFTWDPVVASVKKSAEAAHKIGFLRAPPVLTGLFFLGPLNEVLQERHLPPVIE